LVSKFCHELVPALSRKVGREFDAVLSIHTCKLGPGAALFCDMV
jgi:hypothetical protein